MSDILENDRLRALCCICGQLRTLSKRNPGRVRGSVTTPLEPEQLREYQSRGVYLDVEPHWRRLLVLKCHHCGEWTRHAVIAPGSVYEDGDGDEPAKRLTAALEGREPPCGPASYYGQLEALEELGVVVCWAPTLSRAAIWIPSECLLILNSSRTRAEHVAGVASLWPSIIDPPPSMMD